MARSINKAILIGRLGKDPELNYLPSGQAVAKFTLATNRSFKDKTGEWKEETQWHNIVVWGKTAETCNQYLAKGSQAYIEGRIQSRDWEDREGKKRTSFEIVADNVVLLGSRGEERPGGSPTPAAAGRAGQSRQDTRAGGQEEGFGDMGSPEITDDDIPF